MKFTEVLSEWLCSINGTVKLRTEQYYRQLISSHIKPYFNDVDIRTLTSKDFQKYVVWLGENSNIVTGGGLSSSTIQVIMSVIKQAMQYAVINGYVSVSPLLGVRQRKRVCKIVEAFTKEEQQAIEMFATTNRKYFGVILSLYTGVRIGELLALKWDDFDENNDVLKINQTTFMIKTDSGKWEQVNDSPKTQSSIREIPIATKTKKLLIAHRKKSCSEYIIDNKGNQMQVRHYQTTFEYMLKKLNIKHKGFHAIRHTFATRALECGVDIKTLSELLGHSKTSITLDRYVHTSLQQKKKAINLLAKNNNN